jgi:hypothetical protein
MAVIARVLGHADTHITEKHYAHLAPNYVAESVRSHFPRLAARPEIPQPAFLSSLRTLRPAVNE